MFSLVSGALQLTTAAAGKVIETAATAATIPVRAVALIGQTELLINRITLAAGRAEELIDRVSAVATAAESAVAETRAITTAAAIAVEEVTAIATRANTAIDDVSAIATRANTAIDDVSAIAVRADTTIDGVTSITTRANRVADEVETLVGDYSPTLRQAAPLAARFVSELTPDEVTAAIRMIDELPALQRHLVHDVMPLLGKLDQMGPDLHKLLEVTEDLHLAIAGLPGLKMLRRRGEERVGEQG